MKIYKYNISKKYNKNLFPIFITQNDIILNEKLDNELSQYSAEIYYNNILTNSNFITNNIFEADIIYIPVYTFLLAWNDVKFRYNSKKGICSRSTRKKGHAPNRCR